MSDERKPFYVTCGDCQHNWIAAYTPMELGAMVKVVGNLHCPMCGVGAKRIFMGKSVTATVKETPA